MCVTERMSPLSESQAKQWITGHLPQQDAYVLHDGLFGWHGYRLSVPVLVREPDAATET